MDKKATYSKRLKAFTLSELMVVLVIIGILVLMALPKLMPLISRAKSAEAQVQLSYLHDLEQYYFYMYSTYNTNLEEIGFDQNKLITEGGIANYRIEVVQAGPNYFVARATAVVDFDRDGIFNVWEIDQDKKLKEVTRD